MKTVQLVKDRSIHNTRGAFVTFEIIGGDIMEHILLSVAPPGTVFEMSYQIVEAGTQKGNLNDTGNTPNRDQDENLHTLTTATHTSTSNEKDRAVPKHFVGWELTNLAAVFCNDSQFWEWAGVANEKEATEFVLCKCKMKTIVDLDFDGKAGACFKEIMHIFDIWKKRRDIEKNTNPGRPKGGELAKWAGILCNDELFRRSLCVETVDQARSLILSWCKVSSRAELDHDKNAGYLFRGIMHDFDAWKKTHVVPFNPDNTLTVDDMPKHISNIPGNPLTRDDLETIYNKEYRDDLP